MLGGGGDVAGGRVDHQHASSGGCLHINVVNANACPRDDAQALACGNHRSRHLRLAAHDQRVIGRDGGDQVSGAEAVALIHLGKVAQDGDTIGGDRIGDEDARARHVAGDGCLRMWVGHE